MIKQSNKCILLVGISGSGKSIWSTQFIKNNSNYLRTNRDDIRKVLVGNLEDYYERKDFNKIPSDLRRDYIIWVSL